jgi:tetratricopeptide (TPR) repeat protein
MALAVLKDRLAAPTEATAVPPEPLGASSRAFDRVVLEVAPEDDLVAGFLAQARSLAERFAQSGTALARAAQVELAIGDHDDALGFSRRALERASEQMDVPAMIAAGQVLLLAGEKDLAEELLLPLDAHTGVPTMLAQLAAERRDFPTALARLASDDSGPGRHVRGWLYILMRQYRKAIRELRQASIDLPSPSAFVNLGYAHGALAQYDRAIRATQSAIHLSPADRTAGFNLGSYYILLGQFERARAELGRLSQYHPGEIGISFAIAEIFVREGNLQGALDELRRTRASQVAWGSDRVDRAELSGNITFLEFRLGLRDERVVADRLERALRDTEYRSLGIARLLASVFTTSEAASRLDSLYTELLRVHPKEDLYEVATKVALLRRDFDMALALACAWVEDDPFNENGGVLATYLLSEVFQRHDEAAEIGFKLLPRFPASMLLANNTAYALLMCGRVTEARRILETDAGRSRCAEATAALLELASGNLEKGLSGYQRAAVLAEADGDFALAALIRYRLELIRADLGNQTRDSVVVPDGFQEDPRFGVVRHARLLPPPIRVDSMKTA